MFFQRCYIFWHAFILTFYLSITFTKTLCFHRLSTLLTLNVAVHSCGSIKLASLPYTYSVLLSLSSHRLKNRHETSAIKRFGICTHHFRRRIHRGQRKQHAIKVIDTGFKIITCLNTRMDRRNLINVHSMSKRHKNHQWSPCGMLQCAVCATKLKKNLNLNFYM